MLSKDSEIQQLALYYLLCSTFRFIKVNKNENAVVCFF